ncbi:hypothetical protein B0F90DRAFT_1743026 [Multifurca ochricompacta]|uniref:Uncharacterized protein n=1 Tax=Multifurca ochricompacta TaxID=376703 RepID=A0AAD4LZZ3_9AGAM|nr:hypothetical protein B0F90DRAFT_1743026 [Multifurca ochricompacta]
MHYLPLVQRLCWGPSVFCKRGRGNGAKPARLGPDFRKAVHTGPLLTLLANLRTIREGGNARAGPARTRVLPESIGSLPRSFIVANPAEDEWPSHRSSRLLLTLREIPVSRNQMLVSWTIVLDGCRHQSRVLSPDCHNRDFGSLDLLYFMVFLHSPISLVLPSSV